MATDEREIFQYLKTWGADFVSAREIARRAGGKKKFHDDPDWVKPLLIAMHQRGVIECDSMGRYRVKPISKKDNHAGGTSAEIAAILMEAGVTASDDYYEQL